MQDEAEQRETWCAMTLLYVCLEMARTCPINSKKLKLRSQFCMSFLALNLLLALTCSSNNEAESVDSLGKGH
jgi:hypothetical protein